MNPIPCSFSPFGRAAVRGLCRTLPLTILVVNALDRALAQSQNAYVVPYTITTFAGGGSGFVNGTGLSARFNHPRGVAVDAAGNLFVADSDNSAIRKITPTGVVSTLAGGSTVGSVDGTGPAAQFFGPAAIAIDGAGTLYVSDYYNGSIRRVTAAGVVTTVPGTVSLPGHSSGLGAPTGVAVDAAGAVYFADINHAIYRIATNGTVSTLAGTALQSGSADGTGAVARFYYPHGIAVDSAGNVFVADTVNNTIRKITATGVVTTLAGTPTMIGDSVDGTGTAARFNGPTGLAIDPQGNLYVAEAYTLRFVTPAGVVTTLAGDPGDLGGNADGVGSVARFNQPGGLAVGAAGVLFVADTLNSTIRRGTPPAPTITAPPQSRAVAPGASVALSVAASGNGTLSYRWQHNGTDLTGATSPTLTLNDVQPASAGLYSAVVTDSRGTTTSDPAILGITSTAKAFGNGLEIASDIRHPNGNFYDQVLLTGMAETISANPGQATRTSFIDLNGDIVQVEFAGAGSLSLVLADPTGPAAPTSYNQPSVAYMKGHAGIVITGANATTHVAVFTVGRATAFDPTGHYNILLAPSDTNVPASNGSSLFVGHGATAYDGVADLAFIAIVSTGGEFGSVRTANARYWATQGYTGVYAPGVRIVGPLFVGNINAHAAATPVLQVGSVTDARITGGDMLQANQAPVLVSGLTQLRFTAGSDSHGHALPAQLNRASFRQNGADVTTQIVANPVP